MQGFLSYTWLGLVIWAIIGLIWPIVTFKRRGWAFLILGLSFYCLCLFDLKTASSSIGFVTFIIAIIIFSRVAFIAHQVKKGKELKKAGILEKWGSKWGLWSQFELQRQQDEKQKLRDYQEAFKAKQAQEKERKLQEAEAKKQAEAEEKERKRQEAETKKQAEAEEKERKRQEAEAKKQAEAKKLSPKEELLASLDPDFVAFTKKHNPKLNLFNHDERFQAKTIYTNYLEEKELRPEIREFAQKNYPEFDLSNKFERDSIKILYKKHYTLTNINEEAHKKGIFESSQIEYNQDPTIKPKGKKLTISQRASAPRWKSGASGNRVKIEYVDAYGEVTEREISNWVADGTYIKGFCLLRQQNRIFKKKNILKWEEVS